MKDQYWDGYNTTPDADRFAYAHDYVGNRTSRDIDSALYATNDQDHIYAYDGLHRLKTFDEGVMASGSITTPLEEQDWTLDALGNWSNLIDKTSGTATLNQTRKHNKVNEIEDPVTPNDLITETTGPSWVSPVYDAAGNITTIPRPKDPTLSFMVTYDAWNRLVSLDDGTSTTAFEYDGLN